VNLDQPPCQIVVKWLDDDEREGATTLIEAKPVESEEPSSD
jgi:hypothetical protein